MKKYSIIIKFSMFMMLGMFLISACQILPSKPPEQILQNRVDAMMAARIGQDWKTVYDCLDPDYRDQVSIEDFLSVDRNIAFSDFTVESIQIEPSGRQAVVVVKYNMTLMAFDFEIRDHQETQNWIKVGRKWYYQMSTERLMEKD